MEVYNLGQRLFGHQSFERAVREGKVTGSTA